MPQMTLNNDRPQLKKSAKGVKIASICLFRKSLVIQGKAEPRARVTSKPSIRISSARLNFSNEVWITETGRWYNNNGYKCNENRHTLYVTDSQLLSKAFIHECMHIHTPVWDCACTICERCVYTCCTNIHIQLEHIAYLSIYQYVNIYTHI